MIAVPAIINSRQVKFEPELLTYIEGLVTPIPYAQKVRLNKFIVELKTGLGVASLSSVFDAMYIYANETEEIALRNVIKRQHDSTKIGPATFAKYKGFVSNGSGYINTNYNPATSAIAYTRNSASYGIYSRSDVNSPINTHFDIGNHDGTNASEAQIRTGTSFSFKLNADLSSTSTASTNSTGMMIVSRTSSSVTTPYIRAAAGTNSTRASRPLINYNFFVLATNRSGTPIGFTTREIAFVFFGKGLTQSDVNVITTAFDNYSTRIGKNVIPNNGKLVITSDDGALEEYTNMAPFFAQNNKKCTFYIISSFVGTPGFMTWAQIQELKESGFDIQCHSYSHVDLRTLTVQQLNDDYNNANTAFELNNLTPPTEHAYPFGFYNQQVKDVVATKRRTARTIDVNMSNANSFFLSVDRFNIVGKAIENSRFTTGVMDTLKSQMLSAKTNRRVLVLYTHSMGSGIANTSNEIMQEIIDYADNIGLDIITASELGKLIEDNT